MTFRDGAVGGSLFGAGLWSIFRTVDWIGNFNTWFTTYPMQTFVSIVFASGVVMGIITLNKHLQSQETMPQ